MLQNMKCVLGLFMLCLLACTENKYAGIPEKYHALLDQALVKAGDNATELTAALKNAVFSNKKSAVNSFKSLSGLYAGKRFKGIDSGFFIGEYSLCLSGS